MELATFSGGKGGTHTALPEPFFSVSIVSEDDMNYHYTYRLTALNPIDERRYYIGVRSCDCLPEDDAYMSSSRTVAKLIASGVQFQKEIIALWPTRKEAVAHEVALHDLHDVGRNGEWFNRAKQTSTSYDTGGTTISEKHKRILADAVTNPDVLKKRSASIKAAYSNQKLRDKVSARTKLSLSRPEVRAKLSESVKAYNSSPEVRLKKSLIAKLSHARPEVKARLSAAAKAVKARPEVKAKQVSLLLLRRKYCAAKGITKPGSGFCNIDKQDFRQWLKEQSNA